ncbi:MAG TPA: alkaline phosphatase D family protein, partial [Lacibacter sp.]|nr:alkaline phosphatase D family protein [Lacibacter sp.]
TRLVVSTSPTFSNPIYSQPINVTSATNFVGSYSIGGLTPGTEYFYGIESNGLLDPRPGATGRFKTPLEGPHSFSFTAGACNLNSRNPVWQRIREKDPLFMLVSGDLHYSDPNSTNVNVHRIPYEDRVLSIENTRTLFNNVPIAYVWDDHDFSGDDSNASSTGANSAKQAYREYVPHYPFGTGITSGNSAIYQSFVIGRVRFLLTDLRSEKTDDAVMSAQQVQWFRQQCLEAKAQQQLICWVSSFGITANNTDAWGGTSANLAQRNELFSFLAANNIDNLFVLSGDAHAAGIDDGANTDCSGVLDTHTCPRFTCSLNPRYPLLQAAGLSNTVSIKGIVTNILPMTGQDHHGQYAKVDVTDNGSDSVTVRFTVYRVHPDTGVESVLGTYSFSRHLGAASNRSTPVTTGDSWKYLDNGSDQGTTWRAGSFNDAGWAEGPAPLGYAMTGLRTTVSFGSDANNKHITTYFRKAFTVANVCRVKAAYLELSVDDGAVLYLNNREVGRANFAAGAYNHLTPASDVVTNRGQTFRFWITDTSFFRTGTNLLAVEVHQHAGNSSDLFFNLHVTLEESDEPVTSTTTVTACNAFTWNGQTYTESGTYSFATLTAAGGDSLARLQLTINRVPITAQPAPVTAVVDESASFTVSTSAGGATFRWQRDAGSGFQDLDNSPPFSGANTATLTVAPLTLAFNNDLYRCVVTASSCSTESGSALLRVNLPTRVVERPTGLPLRLYPNPVLDQLVLEGDPRLAGQPYQIRDALGRQVRSGLLTAATTTLQLEQLPAGIYTLHIGRQGEQRMRFVKQGNK